MSAVDDLARAKGLRERVANASRDLERATREAIIAADREGIPKVEIARLAGVTRQTVYDVLRKL